VPPPPRSSQQALGVVTIALFFYERGKSAVVATLAPAYQTELGVCRVATSGRIDATPTLAVPSGTGL